MWGIDPTTINVWKNKLHSVLLCSCFHVHWSAGALLAGPLVNKRKSEILSFCPPFKPSLADVVNINPCWFWPLSAQVCSKLFVGEQAGGGCDVPALVPAEPSNDGAETTLFPKWSSPDLAVPSPGREQSHHLPLRSPDSVQGRKIPAEGQRCLWVAIQPAQQAGKVIK